MDQAQDIEMDRPLDFPVADLLLGGRCMTALAIRHAASGVPVVDPLLAGDEWDHQELSATLQGDDIRFSICRGTARIGRMKISRLWHAD